MGVSAPNNSTELYAAFTFFCVFALTPGIPKLCGRGAGTNNCWVAEAEAMKRTRAYEPTGPV